MIEEEFKSKWGEIWNMMHPSLAVDKTAKSIVRGLAKPTPLQETPPQPVPAQVRLIRVIWHDPDPNVCIDDRDGGIVFDRTVFTSMSLDLAAVYLRHEARKRLKRYNRRRRWRYGKPALTMDELKVCVLEVR